MAVRKDFHGMPIAYLSCEHDKQGGSLSDDLRRTDHVVLTEDDEEVAVCVSLERYATLERALEIVETLEERHAQEQMAEAMSILEQEIAEASPEEQKILTRVIDAAKREAESTQEPRRIVHQK